MAIPASLLSAIATAGGGQVALFVGAGCSKEDPTGLPLAGECAMEAHRQLVDNNVLAEDECAEPWDLSALADLVKSKNGDKQAELVKCLPYKRFKNATANEGHLIATALLLEGAITNIITLNYDSALSDALNTLGVEDEISIVNGPDQHAHLGRSNVIYLHRSVDNDFEEWILTSEALEEAWKDAWEETIVRSVITAPVSVFAGMGSSCGVLRHSTKKIRQAVGESAQLFVANPGDASESKFAVELSVKSENYVPLKWVDFMRQLGARFHKEVVANLKATCLGFAKREGFVDPVNGKPLDDIEELTKRVHDLGILGFGAFRGSILLDCRQFPKIENGHVYSIAGLLLAVGCIERLSNAVGRFGKDGHVVFSVDGRRDVPVLLIDGSTRNLSWLTLENEMRQHEDAMSHSFGKKSRRVVAIGVTGTRPENATPPNSIIGVFDDDDILDGDYSFQCWDVVQIREDAGSIERLLG